MTMFFDVSGLLERQYNAEKSFLRCVAANGINAEDAKLVLAYYLKHKLVKLGATDGQFHIKSGVFMEADPMREAVRLSR